MTPGTVIGTEYVVRQPSDGYTMLMIGPSFTPHAVLRTGLAFDIREANVRIE